MFKKLIIKIFLLISKIYIFIFGRKVMQKLNYAIFLLTLKAQGYTNFGNHKNTGEYNFIKLIKKDLKICIDIGANVGSYAKEILMMTDAKVIAIEPLSGAFEKLKKLKEKFNDRLTVLNYGVGEKSVEKKLYFSNETSELASFYENANKFSFVNNKNKKYQIVRIKRIDDISELHNFPKVDLLKIDTEGYEMNVLKGALNFIKEKKIKFIQIEFNVHQIITQNNIYEFSKVLSGYEPSIILPYGYPLKKIDPLRPENNIFHLSNFVFIKKNLSKSYL